MHHVYPEKMLPETNLRDKCLTERFSENPSGEWNIFSRRNSPEEPGMNFVGDVCIWCTHRCTWLRAEHVQVFLAMSCNCRSDVARNFVFCKHIALLYKQRDATQLAFVCLLSLVLVLNVKIASRVSDSVTLRGTPRIRETIRGKFRQVFDIPEKLLEIFLRRWCTGSKGGLKKFRFFF